ncbi:MAG: hypothetical protein M1409_02550 [Actinobacteria bacterium]|nr:hypothetical protein [Actinomycetota bacterium]
MNSRERVFLSINHKVPDRIPLDGWFLNERLEKLKNFYNISTVDDLLFKLGIDFRSTCMRTGPAIAEEYSYFKKMGLSIMIDDYFVKDIGNDELEDEWGVKIKTTGLNDLDWKYSYHPLNNHGRLSLDNLNVPDVDRSGRFDRVEQDVKNWKDKFIVCAGVSTLFRKCWILCGYTRFLEALYTDREFVEDLLDILTEFYISQIRKYINSGIDIIQFGGDLGTEESLMISPKIWREIFKPRDKRIINQTKKENVYYYLHSDGNIESIIPDLIENGFDIINPIQPECMDPGTIKKKYGDKITLHGTMSMQNTFAFGSKESIKNEVTSRIKNCGYNGGLILSPSNAFTEDIPIENIIYFYDFVRSINPANLINKDYSKY